MQYENFMKILIHLVRELRHLLRVVNVFLSRKQYLVSPGKIKTLKSAAYREFSVKSSEVTHAFK